MAKSAIDAEVNNSIFRKDNPIIIALRRDLAQLSPVRLAYDVLGYLPGQVLCQNTGDKLFYKYSAASGSYPAVCVLFEPISPESQLNSAVTGNALARALFAGFVYTNLLLDYSAQAKTDLKSRDYVDAGAFQITKF